MSAYIYCLTSKTAKIKINGEIHEAGILKYAYKPYHSFWDKEPRWQILAKARIARMANIWEGRGFTPKYVVVGDKPQKDAGVLDWHSKGDLMAVATYDDPDWGGRKFMGTLNENFELTTEIKNV